MTKVKINLLKIPFVLRLSCWDVFRATCRIDVGPGTNELSQVREKTIYIKHVETH